MNVRDRFSGLSVLLLLLLLGACARSPDVPVVAVTPVPTDASEAATPITGSGMAAMGTPTLEGEAASDTEADESADPREPQGDPEVFWNEMSWGELRPTEQELWGVLGWDETSWDEEVDIPASEEKTWDELTDAEQDAAAQLGYTQEIWDATAPQ